MTKKSAPLAYEMKGDFTRKLRTILISGKLFNAIDKNILMVSKNFHIALLL